MESENIANKPLERPYEDVYANNTSVELSSWDLKILFGQIDQYTGKTFVNWHTAVTMPWMQAKILAYFLRAHVTWHETQNGFMKVPSSLIPPKLELPVDAEGEVKQWYEFTQKLHEETFGPTAAATSPSAVSAPVPEDSPQPSDD